MSRKEIPDSAIETGARHINNRSNKNYGINPIGSEANIETPQVFEILPFDEIDSTDRRFYAIDGSYNTEQFYNGLAIAVYTAGYTCFHHGQRPPYSIFGQNGVILPLGDRVAPESRSPLHSCGIFLPPSS
jgi:hypothetical protein